MKRIRAGSSPPTAAMPSPRSSSAWARARCTCRNCRAFRASRPSRDIRSTPAAGITITPAAIPRARAWTSSPTSASASSAPARRPCSACRIWPARPRNSTCSSARRPPSTSAPTRRSIPTGFRASPSPGWQQRWLENFTANQAGGNAEEDLVQDGWTDLSRRIRAKILQLPREQRIRAEHAGRV